ncbi:H-2 class I histocompatibility antigen, Q9 alpha chain-like [Polyodon spathula]|uniref:H-2 class I histocompatibility antigen, Q9 alpha chain-like n=1 Tax=Polyodon spathula TaxID=7913 RepID=UPI001B7E8571|nr:H-2 class I histocompatibility antigen, Q9 alpha chain-like [Polyodon spathula]
MLRALVLAILCCFHAASAGSHSLRYFFTGVSGGMGFPEFTAVGLVDNVQHVHYDSVTKKMRPTQDWMERSVGPEYWEGETQKAFGTQQVFKDNIGVAMQRFNQTGGVHTVQRMVGCELDDDGTKRGFDQHGFDGMDYVSFDMDTLTWIATIMQAVITKHKWDADRARNYGLKVYLETECIEWLQKYVQNGRETLERRVPPEVTLLQRKTRGSADMEVLCHVTGFFPRAVAVNWVRDGQDQLEEGVQSGEVLPNQDGTYQLRKILTLSPEEQGRHRYSCQVDHISFKERQIYIWDPNMRSSSEVPGCGSGCGSSIRLIVGVVAVLALAAAVIGVVIWKRRQGGV